MVRVFVNQVDTHTGSALSKVRRHFEELRSCLHSNHLHCVFGVVYCEGSGGSVSGGRQF